MNSRLKLLYGESYGLIYNEMCIRDRYYSVPWNMDCTGLYYNKERLDELGIDVPTTWKELSDAVDKVCLLYTSRCV